MALTGSSLMPLRCPTIRAKIPLNKKKNTMAGSTNPSRAGRRPLRLDGGWGQAARDVNGLTAHDRHVDRRFCGGLATASERAISVEIDAELIEPALAARPGKRRPKNGGLQRRASAAVAAPDGVPTGASASAEGDIGFCAVSSSKSNGKASWSAAKCGNRGWCWNPRMDPSPTRSGGP